MCTKPWAHLHCTRLDLLRRDEPEGLRSVDDTELKERTAEMNSEVGVGVLPILRKVVALAPVRDRLGAVDQAVGEQHVQVRDCDTGRQH